MSKKASLFQSLPYYTVGLICILLITDFLLTGSHYRDIIVGVEKKREQYYNAAQNYHFSYLLVTKTTDSFYIPEDFAKAAQSEEFIEYSRSLIFDQVNWFRFNSDQDRSYYSLRLIGGLILPILALSLLSIARFGHKDWGILSFILQILVIGDLVLILI